MRLIIVNTIAHSSVADRSVDCGSSEHSPRRSRIVSVREQGRSGRGPSRRRRSIPGLSLGLIGVTVWIRSSGTRPYGTSARVDDCRRVALLDDRREIRLGVRRPARNSTSRSGVPGSPRCSRAPTSHPETEAGGPVGGGGGWWWHTPKDTRDKVDVDVLTEEVKLYTALVSHVCESTVLPPRLPGDRR